MAIHEPAPTFTVNVYTRHSADCPFKTNPQYKKCNCRKSVSIYDGGKMTYRSAGTRTWKTAEAYAQTLRDARDPVKKTLAEIAEKEAAETAAKEAAKADQITIEAALDQWLAGKKVRDEKTVKRGRNSGGRAKSTVRVYAGLVRKIKDWAEREKLIVLADVQPGHLDKWRSQWGSEAELKTDRMSATTQWNFQSRLKGFFSWAYKNRIIQDDPAKHLESISPSDEETMPLTREQYEQLLEATAMHDKAGHSKTGNTAGELKALFIIQRWTGLRISDVLMMRRDNLNGHRIRLKTKKTGADYEGTVPDLVLEVIASNLPKREGVHDDYLFWSGKSNADTLLAKWMKIIRNLNRHLSFVDEGGKPMQFRSHMLRDTFAVELLLADVPLEKVSKLLTHSDIATTERYYARWVESRRQKLQDELVLAMRRMGVTVSI